MASGHVKIKVSSVADLFKVNDNDGDGYLSRGDTIGGQGGTVTLDEKAFRKDDAASVYQLSKIEDDIELATGREVRILKDNQHSRSVFIAVSAESDRHTLERLVYVGQATPAGKSSIHYRDAADAIVDLNAYAAGSDKRSVKYNSSLEAIKTEWADTPWYGGSTVADDLRRVTK